MVASFGGRAQGDLTTGRLVGEGGILALGEPLSVPTTTRAPIEVVAIGPDRITFLDQGLRQIRTLTLLDDDLDGEVDGSTGTLFAPVASTIVALASGPAGTLFIARLHDGHGRSPRRR